MFPEFRDDEDTVLITDSLALHTLPNWRGPWPRTVEDI